MIINRLPAKIQRHWISSFILTLLLATAPLVQGADSTERRVSGQWKFIAALDGADIVSLDEHEAQKLIGHIFLISKHRVKFDDRDCGETGFAAQKVEPNLHLRKAFHADAEKLGLPNPVTVVDLSCTSVFIKSSNRLVIAWQGWFFEAVRVKR
ncbi:hypothetical protein [Massilia sp. HP4]|uniref:hypothetical protein n=1 Tax=Massilia sp. HP4 TaxID=2562316 RepID=UPI0010BF9AB2|nr:hypothetical protein [Massilia sp. HP4]